MPIKATIEPLGVTADAAALVGDLQAALDHHWTSSLLAGSKASGGSLPPNKAGRPLGLGDGSVATTWVSTPVQGDEHRASASSSPGQDGGLFYAVRAMVDADANPASIEGRAAGIIDQVVARHADKAVQG